MARGVPPLPLLLCVTALGSASCAQFGSGGGSQGTGAARTGTPPSAVSGALTAAQDLASSLRLQGSDSGGLPLTYIVTTQASHGSVVIDDPATGAATYMPSSGYLGTDSFGFKVTNGTLTSAEAVISITVQVNTAPIAYDGSLTVDQNSSDNAGSLSATDGESNPLTYSVVAQPANGTVTITDAVTGAYAYTPAPGFSGSDSFTFKASDTVHDSNTATVTLAVDAPPWSGNLSSQFVRADSATASSGTLALPSTTKFTLAIWLKMAGTPENNEAIYAIVDHTGPRHLRIYWQNSSTLRAELYDGGTVPLTSTSITPTSWNHVVFCWDSAGAGNNFKLFVNGSLVASMRITGSIDYDFDDAEHVEVGHYNNADFLDGWVDDVAYWNSALSDTEVAAIYNSGSQIDYRSDFGAYVSSTNLQYYWWMGDGSVLPTISPAKGNAPLSASGVVFDTEAP